MQIKQQLLLTCILTICIIYQPVFAKEITLDHKGLSLNADLSMAAGKTMRDGVILITHGALAHRDMEMLRYMRGLLKERGYNTLAINLSLAITNRHGMYDCKIPHHHTNEDAIEEITAWMTWLHAQGTNRVTLMGHSRGGVQTALYAAEHDNAFVHAVVLLAPATADNTSAKAYQNRYKQALPPILKQARTLVKQGQHNHILAHADLLTCRDTAVSAASFVSYYGQDKRLDTPALLAKIKKPTLVVIGSNDQIVVNLDKKITSLVNDKKIQMNVIEGAGHFFRDLNADDAIDAIDEFLANLGS